MEFRGLALVFGVVVWSGAAGAESLPVRVGVNGGPEPIAAVYFDGIALNDDLTLGASGRSKANSRFIASGFTTTQSIDFTSAPLRRIGTEVTEPKFTLPVQGPVVVEAPVSIGRPAESTAEAADSAIESGNYAPLLAGLGVLGFLAMRRIGQ